jgi:hypothetical protein
MGQPVSAARDVPVWASSRSYGIVSRSSGRVGCRDASTAKPRPAVISVYHALRLKVEKRFSHGLSVLLTFTGQKLIDDYAIISNVGNNTGGNDISNHLVVSGIYNLPFRRGQQFGSHWNRAVDTFLGGPRVNGIATNQSGFPLSLTTQNTSGSGSNVLRPNSNG